MSYVICHFWLIAKVKFVFSVGAALLPDFLFLSLLPGSCSSEKFRLKMSSTMYNVNPVFKKPSSFTHSANMYSLKNLMDSTQEPIIQDDTKSNDQSLRMQLIVHKQEELIKKLKDFHDSMTVFYKEKLLPLTVLNDRPAEKFSEFLSDPLVNDLVVNADPSYPPFSLLAMVILWPELPVRITLCRHSTMKDIGCVAPFDKLKQRQMTSKHVHILLVWKSDLGPDCELITSPVAHKHILGEANLTRFLVRLAGGEGPLSNDILDATHQFVHGAITAAAYRAAVESRVLSKDAEKYPELTAVWSTLLNFKEAKEEFCKTSELKNWYLSMAETIGRKLEA